jgi:hypothetical protein
MTSRWLGVMSAAVLLACTGTARADEEVDVSKLYEITTEGSSRKLEPGKPGTFVFSVKTVEGAYISDEAPLRIDLSGKKVKPAKERLTLADSVTRDAEKKPPPDPRFEVPITPDGQGKGEVEAKATLFICTAKLCVRQQRTVSVPVEVN